MSEEAEAIEPRFFTLDQVAQYLNVSVGVLVLTDGMIRGEVHKELEAAADLQRRGR